MGPTHPHSTSPPPAEEQKGETPMELEEEDSCSSLPTPVGGGGEKDPVETSTHTQGEGNTSGNTSPPTPVGGDEKVREETSTLTQGQDNMDVPTHSPPPRGKGKMQLKARRRLPTGGDGTQSPGAGGTAPLGPGQHAPSPELDIPKWQPLLLQTCMAAIAQSSVPTHGCGQVGNFTFPSYGVAPCMQFLHAAVCWCCALHDAVLHAPGCAQPWLFSQALRQGSGRGTI